MDWLTPDRYLSAMESEAARFAAAVSGRDPGEAVPTCPDWTVRDLVTHVGTGHRLSAAVVSARAGAPGPYELIDAPEDPREWTAWLVSGAAGLIGAVREQGFATRVWTWIPEHPTVGFWLRRMLHDLIVHRFDADPGGDLDEDLALDGVADILLCYAQPRFAVHGTGETLQFTTGAHGWHVTLTPDGVSWRPGTGPADVEVQASPRDLLLILNRRRPPAVVHGDAALLAKWLAATRF
ncbi:maleylpyruvate isomerase family mycothiol-dependent enzyme [Actinoplanes couchii]|uniref:Mycothiol-dependent maleylpyruvate isomerase metal-binding domain-containing protein n=1 Tax=Actinoplanes couchii TaxID=403638 RepID=A0ABQ3XPI1_9ACTN|nr:maleylpyruvate isomerase family mycothiol-dependent enzyme [Actinoplanes couchii]MDR6319075.1 uncharacterized protein (TIGR03083 family) [Actinoplanes couchii]GID60418.1 hypothetical protein Aco03nite_088220 [Actinoplanes couchii]